MSDHTSIHPSRIFFKPNGIIVRCDLAMLFATDNYLETLIHLSDQSFEFLVNGDNQWLTAGISPVNLVLNGRGENLVGGKDDRFSTVEGIGEVVC